MSRSEFDPDSDDYKSHAASGFLLSGFSQIVKIITQFVSVIVLARLLSPSDFGLVAMVAPIHAFAMMFSDMGISQAVMQRKQLTSEQVNAFFWFNVMIGVSITLLLCAISPLVAVFYDETEVLMIMIAMAAMVTVSGLGNIHGNLMQRRMMFKEQAVINISGVLIGLAASVLAAVLLENHWAIVIGMAVTTIIASVGVWFAVGWRPSWPKWAEGATDMLKFGLGIAGGNSLKFFFSNVANIVIGKSFGEYALGLYERSGRLLMSPVMQATYPLSGVIVPILCRVQDDEERYKRVFLRAAASLIFLLAPGVIWAVVYADALIDILLGDQWKEAAPLFAILSLGVLPVLFNMVAEWLFMTQGRGSEYAKYNLYSGLGMILALVVGVQYGLIGVAVAILIYRFINTPCLWVYATRKGAVTLATALSKLSSHIVGLIVGGGTLCYLSMAVELNVWLELGAGLCFCYLITMLTIMIFPHGRAAIYEDVSFGYSMLLSMKMKLQARRKK